MEAAAKAAGYDLDAAKEDAANPASIRDVQAHPTDIARMGYDRAQRHAELMVRRIRERESNLPFLVLARTSWTVNPTSCTIHPE